MKNVIVCLLFCSTFILSKGQIIHRFAGHGFGGGADGLGDGLHVDSAITPNPGAGIFDKYGNYYFVSATDQRVRKVDTNNIITCIAGTGNAGYNGDGGLADTSDVNNPSGVAVDTLGNIYISESQSNRVRKVNVSNGIITTVVGNGISGFYGDGGLAINANLADINDVCVDRKGNIYVADYGNSRVRKVNPSGIITTFAGNGLGGYSGDGGLADTSAIGGVVGICVDKSGNVYLSSISNAMVFKVDTDGIISRYAGTSTGYLYNGDSIAATTAQIYPCKIACDEFGNLFIADKNNSRIRKIDTSGIIYTVAGNGIVGDSGDGGQADLAAVGYPNGIALDRCGNLYIPEANDDNIRRVIYDSACVYINAADTTDTTTSVHNTATQNSISIYPNPAKEQLTVAGGSNDKDVAILNAMGQVILEQHYNSYNAHVNVSGLKEGLYYISVKDEKSGRIVRMKFLKE